MPRVISAGVYIASKSNPYRATYCKDDSARGKEFSDDWTSNDEASVAPTGTGYKFVFLITPR